MPIPARCGESAASDFQFGNMNAVSPANPQTGARAFPPTRWRLIGGLQSADETTARRSLEELCRIYWQPLYCHARRCGRSPEDAEDAAQGFLISLIERDRWVRADQERGRLRTFLLAGMKHWLMNEARDAGRLKRGRGRAPVSLDSAEGEVLFQQLGDVATLSPDGACDRHWALAFLRQVERDIAADYAAAGKAELFDELSPFLLDDAVEGGAYEPAMARLGDAKGAVKVAVLRMRGRYRKRLVQRVAATVADDAMVGHELEYLMRLFRP